MAYTTNPHLPKVRMKTVRLVHQGWTVRKASRYIGVSPGTVSKWLKKDYSYGTRPIPTLSSRPHSHPNQLKEKIVNKIIELRLKRNRCAEVVHQEMLNLGYSVSLSSIKRTLKRHYLIRQRSPWKRWHFEEKRPLGC